MSRITQIVVVVLLGTLVAGAAVFWFLRSKTAGPAEQPATVAPAAERARQESKPAASLNSRVAAGHLQSLAIREDGSVWFWGAPPAWLDLKGIVLAPGGPLPVGKAKAVAAQGFWSAVLTDRGEVVQWNGQRLKVGGLPAVTAFSLAEEHSLAIDNDGSVWIWSFAETGPVTSLKASRVSGLPKAVAVAAGHGFSLALDEAGQVWAWGENRIGQLGQAGDHPRPVRVPGLPAIQAIAAGYDWAMALAEDGTVWTWGGGFYINGLVGGNGDEAVRPTKTSLADVVAIAAGRTHGLAIHREGHVTTWGLDPGERHKNALTLSRQPDLSLKPVPRVTNVVAASAGEGHDLFVTQDGQILAWGNNSSGQLGAPSYDGDGQPRTVRFEGKAPEEDLPGPAALCSEEVPKEQVQRVLAALAPQTLKAGGAFPHCVQVGASLDGNVVLLSGTSIPTRDRAAVVAWKVGEDWSAVPMPAGDKETALPDICRLVDGSLINGRVHLYVQGYSVGAKLWRLGIYHLWVDQGGRMVAAELPKGADGAEIIRRVTEPIQQLIEQQKWAEAEKAARQLVNNDPNPAFGWLLLGQAQLGGGNPTAALESLERASAAAGEVDPEVEYYRARAALLAGKKDRALEILKAALAKAPEDERLKQALAEVEAAQ